LKDNDRPTISLKGLNNNNRGQRPRFITNPKSVLARIFVRHDKNRDKTGVKKIKELRSNTSAPSKSSPQTNSKPPQSQYTRDKEIVAMDNKTYSALA
jgi:hypothetical protein